MHADRKNVISVAVCLLTLKEEMEEWKTWRRRKM
jgi:hypothetical protein